MQVKSELFKRGNKYEIVRFILDQSKKSVGLKHPDKPVSIVKVEKETSFANEEEGVKEDDHHPIEELPDKVDLFLDYVNSIYFDGKLDLKTKQIFERDIKFGTRMADTTDDCCTR